jgi:GH15 family glucan-1,4-alpha-glucosidase
MAARIEDYALIGDCETAALVGVDGSIDWLCWPRFDSGACFAALLGDPSNGRWRIAPAGEVLGVARRYRPDTLILETTLETETGTVRVTDFMPPRGEASHLVRLVEGVSGEVAMRMELAVRFDYGATTPWVVRDEDGTLRGLAGPDLVVLRTPVTVVGQDMMSVAEFTVAAGEVAPFVLSYGPSHLDPPPAIDPQACLWETEGFWTAWCSAGSFDGPYAETMKRSLITLKALTYAPTGGIVAAPTTSLPEEFGGERNWDYRYCWIRDATLALLALMSAGHFEEARAWTVWLHRAVAGAPQDMQIMYGLGGERRLMEWEVDWLPGYENSRPVRIGNAAHTQFQIDVYGELMDAAFHARMGGLLEDGTWAVQLAVMDHVAKVWTEPDEGIWEVRSGRQQFTFSKVMAWVAADRAIKSIEIFGLEGPVDEWRALRSTIHADVCANAFNPQTGGFQRAYDDPTADASLLLMAELGFIQASDPRFAATVAAVERELIRPDGLVLRYDTHRVDDGLPPGEGAFLTCSFWLANAYCMLGREDDARRLFERLLAFQTDLGLLSEEYDTKAQRLAGNFPQALSHIGLLSTALNLTHHAKPSLQRAGPRTDDAAEASAPDAAGQTTT